MRYGVLDLTSESLSLAVVEPTPDGQFHTVRRDTVRLRLGRHVDEAAGAPAGMLDLAAETLRRLVALADRADCQRVNATLRADLLENSVGSLLAVELQRLLVEPARQLTDEDQARLVRRAAAGRRDHQHADVDLADAIILDAIRRGSEGTSVAERTMAVAGRLEPGSSRTSPSGRRGHRVG